jgi:[ribosomal protein S5]-alanine N-acetyltransferase
VYAIDIEGFGAGTVSLRRHVGEERFTAEIGYWLAEPFWGRGIMTEAVRAVVEAAFAEPDFYRIFAPVFSWNAASMRVLEKAGFRREGILVRSAIKDETLLDQVVLAITRDPGLAYVPARLTPVAGDVGPR